jgi:hypothetical protein
MRAHIIKLSSVCAVVVLTFVGSSSVLALSSRANVHAQAVSQPSSAAAGASQAGSHQPATGQSNTHLAAAKLKVCKNREKAINGIMSRINTRGQNQITLFDTIATRVENFYTKQGKTVNNYDQLVSAVDAAKVQAQTDLSTLQSNSTFTCDSNNPKATVTAFQSYLKTEITDLKNYKTAVKNLTVAVASANGVTISGSHQSTSQGGQD